MGSKAKDNLKKWIFSVIVFLAFLGSCAGCGNSLLQKRTSEESMDGFYEAATEAGSAADTSIPGQKSALQQNVMQPGIPQNNADMDMYVHVCGCVQEEGLYRLPAGSRIGDAVEQAGGFTEDADSSAVNLAAFVQDGQQVYVPDKSEGRKQAPSGNSGGYQEDKADAAADESGKVNINTADAAELMSLKGIGESKAESIIAYRQEHGAFSSVEEIREVSGIGDGIYNSIKDLITV